MGALIVGIGFLKGVYKGSIVGFDGILRIGFWGPLY